MQRNPNTLKYSVKKRVDLHVSGFYVGHRDVSPVMWLQKT
jgi:hypothetical protein